MLIDEVINFAENEEKKFREIGFVDPFAGGWSFLQNLFELSMQADNNFRTKIWLLERRIDNLVLIVRRLRSELNMPLQEGSVETRNKRYIEIDIDSFFHFAYSILNMLAKLTPSFYKHAERKGLKNKSFNDQKKWFVTHSEIDKEYSEYLRANTSWFKDIEEDRSALAHNNPLITFRSTRRVLTFGTQPNKKGYIPNYPVSDYINEKASGLLEFIQFYDNHFGKKQWHNTRKISETREL